MKRFIARYMLYIYNNFIEEDFDVYKKWAIPWIKPIKFVHDIYIWFFSVVLFPFFLIGMKIDTITNSYNLDEMIKVLNSKNNIKNKNIYINKSKK